MTEAGDADENEESSPLVPQEEEDEGVALQHALPYHEYVGPGKITI